MTYSIEELTKAVRYKSLRAYVIRTALKMTGKDKFTLDEADAAIDEYLKGGVKNG